jgi:hypothetical protein
MNEVLGRLPFNEMRPVMAAVSECCGLGRPRLIAS